MYSVVLVYSEGFDIHLVEDISWEEMNCEAVKTAACTKEEIVEIINLQPDIVFLCTEEDNDIFDIADELANNIPDCIFGIISRKRSFEFARSALNRGISKYIMLPLDSFELEESVECMQYMVREKKCLRYGEKSGFDFDGGLKQIGSFALRNALRYIEKNYSRKLTLEEVAEHIHISKWHLSKLLNSYLGKSFNDVLNGYRLKEAKQLLRDPYMKIGMIAESVGYNDSAIFSHVFKRLEGMTAVEYRNKELQGR